MLRFDNLRILADRFREMYAFYADVLGMKATWGDADSNFVSFHPEGTPGVALFKRELMTGAVGGGSGADRVAVILAVDDLDAAVARIGDRVVAPPRDMPDWGIRTAHVRDPDGNLLELYVPLAKEQWSERLRDEDEKQRS
jgi:predicted enzyme related to lactoylglutathione lyase